MSDGLKYALSLAAVGLLTSYFANAATVNGSTRSGSTSYMFIENLVDNEHFITPTRLDPRFSGSNVWMRYNSNQTSLGYMGYGTTRSDRYVDLWIARSPINTPFRGLRCMNNGSTCPADGAISADAVDKEGIYHVRSGNSIYNGNQPYGLFSSSAYDYFRTEPVGNDSVFEINWCALRSSSADYDYGSGLRCKDLDNSAVYWETYTLTSTKISHLSLVNTNSISEIWVASDGSPSLTNDGQWCSTAIVAGVDGITCKMVVYNLKQSQVINSIMATLVIDTATLGFTPAATDVRFSGDGARWINYRSNYATTTTRYSEIFTPGEGALHVFLSKAFFQKVLQSGANLTGKDSLFTFFFRNTNTPESGFYQFSTSNRVNIIPKEYGISIVSSDGESHPRRSGRVGKSEPIEFEYTVTTSSVRQADAITAQVLGEGVSVDSIPYCLFRSADNGLAVPIPAYLSFTSQTGAMVRQRNSCSGELVEITGANWVQTAWNAREDSGHYYKTNIKLLFPMDDYSSQFSLSNEDWQGTVSASGEIKVSATWQGVK